MLPLSAALGEIDVDAVVGGAVAVVDGDTAPEGDDDNNGPPPPTAEEADVSNRFCEEPVSGKPTAITDVGDIGVVDPVMGMPLMMVVVSSRIVTCCGRIFTLPERAGDE